MDSYFLYVPFGGTSFLLSAIETLLPQTPSFPKNACDLEQLPLKNATELKVFDVGEGLEYLCSEWAATHSLHLESNDNILHPPPELDDGMRKKYYDH